MDEPRIGLTRVGQVPVEHYGQAEIHWLASHATNGARELTVGHTTIAVGGSSPMHRHPNCEEVLHLLSGRIEQVIEGKPSLHMGPGDTILIPRDVKHRAVNTGQVPAVMLVVFSSPQRQTIVESE